MLNMETARDVCARLPLAESCLRLLDCVTHEDFLDQVFARYRGRSYEGILSFPVFVHLLSDALLEHQGSGRQSFVRAQEQGELETSLAAVYGKLARVPLSLSKGFLLDAADRLQQLFPPAARTPLPASLAQMNLLALDGKKLKHVHRRLKVLRQQRGQLLGGKLVVALWVNTRLALALEAHPDGEVSDTPLVPDVLRQVRDHLGGERLWIADRLFCDLDQPALFAQQGDHFISRFNARVSFHPDATRPAQTGTDAQGRPYREEWGWLGAAQNRRRRYVRRITLSRPGDEAVIVVTDLLDGQQYPATDILDAYLLRWEIEDCFQKITEVFSLRRLIGSTPQATIFQAAFCLLLYNVLMVARGYVAEAARLPAEDISLEELFKDTQREVIAWSAVLSEPETLQMLHGYPLAHLPQRLRQVAAGLGRPRWRKTTGARKPAEKRPTEYPPGGHTSVFRLLQRARHHKSAMSSV